jgi:phospholipase C
MIHSRFKKALALASATAICFLPASPAFANNKGFGNTETPIKHLVIIFQENVSFDHYFGTYPSATNPSGEPSFHPKKDTPTVNGLTAALLNSNPNLLNATGNLAGATNPFRLDRSQAVTNDQNHAYGPEQAAAHAGLLDLFPSKVGTAGPPPNAPPLAVTTKGLTMGYYDGNTVTALWNYAQNYAMSDNSFGTNFGPSTPGLMNLVAGQTNGAINILNPNSTEVDGGNGTFTVVGDPDPTGDVCSAPTRNQVNMAGPNIGDKLSAAGVTWGSFMGGFDLTIKNSNGTTGCLRSSTGLSGTTADYIAHHAFFQYWTSTANPTHARPDSTNEIGHDGVANHNYDIDDFFSAMKHNNLPSVSFLKAPAFQDGHAGYSNPLDEQTFVVNVVNTLQKSNYWSDTAIIILYDDSDGWYDHAMAPIVNQSTSSQDLLVPTGPTTGTCGDGSTALPGPPTINGTANHAQGRCGYAVRQPFIVVSPWAKQNFVDHSVTDQTSVIRFIEDNWLDNQRLGDGSFDDYANSITQMFDFTGHRDDNDNRLILNPTTGEVVGH